GQLHHQNIVLAQAQGLSKDDILVMQLPNCVEQHAIYLACAISGIVVSPVPVQYRAHELSHVMDITQAKLVITTQHVGQFKAAQLWTELAHQFPSLQTLLSLGENLPEGVLSLSHLLSQTPSWGSQHIRAHMQACGVTAHDVLTICWTSGTEAKSKGVPRNHNEWLIVGHSVSQAGELKEGAHLLIPFPFVNMAGVSTSLAAWILNGGTLHHHHPFDLAVFIEQLRAFPMDYSVAPPAVLNLLIKEPERMAGVNFSRLKRMGSGGGPLSEWMVTEMKNTFDIEVVNYFGSNEGAALSSSPLDMPDSAQRALYFPRMGVPQFNWKMDVAQKIQTRLVDIDTQQDIVEKGQLGELRFKGPTIFSGYFKSPSLTEKAFDEQGFYRTGDLFEIAGDKGQYYRFAGRHKDIVIRGGMNISSEEIESLLMSHPAVRDVAIIGIPDAIMGERVCAVVARQTSEELTLQHLIDHLRSVREVASFKWPEALVLVDELPRNPVGKVLKRELRERYANAFIPARNPKEAAH
ncbi:MAG: short-chain-fatty-acid--CoA ligase, partial [Betaproteobacteria bacterium]|nr:short-chain-fatty-acid--CoA ligase [Betaproteobacteria bacterium]